MPNTGIAVIGQQGLTSPSEKTITSRYQVDLARLTRTDCTTRPSPEREQQCSHQPHYLFLPTCGVWMSQRRERSMVLRTNSPSSLSWSTRKTTKKDNKHQDRGAFPPAGIRVKPERNAGHESKPHGAKDPTDVVRRKETMPDTVPAPAQQQPCGASGTNPDSPTDSSSFNG